MYSNILVRFGELSTKGKNKMTFVRHLQKNIRKLVGVEAQVEFDRIFLKYSPEVIDKLKFVFGIQSYSPVKRISTEISEMEKTILDLLPKVEGKTFKVSVKRHWKDFPLSSQELNARFGSLILQNSNLTVDVKNPDIKVELEIRDKFTYLFMERYKGLGGYPTGINGKVIHMMSGGIDSPIAALDMMKRGVHVDFLNFVTPPHTDQNTVDKVNEIVTFLIKYQGEAKLFRSNFTDLMNLISLTSNQSYKITLMRRSFYRICSELARKHHYLGISNGENLGQVASQTLESMMVIQSESSFPIYRPVLTADKIEIINKAIEVGTYNLSISECKEACELFAPQKPVIKPTLQEAIKLEEELINLLDFENKNISEGIEILHFKL